MTPNVTLHMDSDLMPKLKHHVVDKRTSLSPWRADQLTRIVEQNETTENVRKDGLILLDKGVHLAGLTCVREELHDR